MISYSSGNKNSPELQSFNILELICDGTFWITNTSVVLQLTKTRELQHFSRSIFHNPSQSLPFILFFNSP